MIQSQRCWWSWWHEMGATIMSVMSDRLAMQQRVEQMHHSHQQDRVSTQTQPRGWVWGVWVSGREERGGVR